MNKFILALAVAVMGISSPLSAFLWSSEPEPISSNEEISLPESASEAEMAALRLLCNKELLLSFLSNPRVMNYFQDNLEPFFSNIIALEPQIDAFKQKHRDDFFIDFWCSMFKVRVMAAKMFQETTEFTPEVISILYPQLIFGFCAYPELEKTVEKKYQEIQTQLFANWLSHQGLLEADPDLLDEILSLGSELEESLFLNILTLLSADTEDSDFVLDGCYFPFIPVEKPAILSKEQLLELGYIFAAPKHLSLGDLMSGNFPSCPSLNINTEEVLKTIHNDVREDFEEDRSSFELCESFLKQQGFEEPFARDKIITLFLDCIIERHPEHKEYFSDVKKNFLAK